MIQSGSSVKVVDNSGAKKVTCIKVLGGYRKRYGGIGDVIMASVKRVRSRSGSVPKVKRGEIVKVLILRCKSPFLYSSNSKILFLENSGIVLSKTNKILSTRIFGTISDFFRKTKFLRVLALGSGISK